MCLHRHNISITLWTKPECYLPSHFQYSLPFLKFLTLLVSPRDLASASGCAKENALNWCLLPPTVISFSPDFQCIPTPFQHSEVSAIQHSSCYFNHLTLWPVPLTTLFSLASIHSASHPHPVPCPQPLAASLFLTANSTFSFIIFLQY